MANRNIIKSNNAIVAVQNTSEAFFTTPKSLNLYNLVQGGNYSVSYDRTRPKQLGVANYTTEDIFRQPDVALTFSYIPEPSFQNEVHGQFVSETPTTSWRNFLGGTLDYSTNFYVLNTPNQEDDALKDITINGSTGSFPDWEIISFGNCAFTEYNFSWSVGSIPTVTTSYICSNLKFDTVPSAGQTTGIQSPAINLQSGNNNDVSDCHFAFNNGKKDPVLISPNSTNSNVTLQNLQVGGQALSGQHFVQGVDMAISLNRSSLYGLGSDYAYKRKALLPAQGTFNVSSLVSGLTAGTMTGVLDSDSSYQFDLVLEGSGKKMIYQIQQAKLVSYNYNLGVNDVMSYDASFIFQIDENNGLMITGTSYS